MSSRIPTKIAGLTPVAKITDGVSRLATGAVNSGQRSNAHTARKQPATTQKNFLTPVKSAQPVTASERKVTASIPTSNRISNTAKKTHESQRALINGDSSSTAASLRRNVTSPSSSNLPACRICGRCFAADRIARHQEICEKSTKKKRKVFDPMKHRLQGTEAEGLINKIKASTKTPQPAVKKTNWRQRHEEFLENIREARKVKQHLAKGGKLSDLPPPKPLDTSDYIQCPHCNRKFNEAAAERHIPKCVNMRHNKPKVPASQAAAPAATKLSRTAKTNITRKR